MDDNHFLQIIVSRVLVLLNIEIRFTSNSVKKKKKKQPVHVEIYKDYIKYLIINNLLIKH